MTETDPQTAVQPSAARAWLLATRPQTLSVAIAPVLVGTAIAAAEQQMHVGAGLAALLGAVLIQIGTNLFNDYSDFKKGADTEQRLGPPRACAQGWLTPSLVWRATLLSFALAMAAGIYLVAHAGWPVIVIGLASILCGLAYTGGPWPLAYLGIADLFVFIFFGLVAVGGTYFVHTGTLSMPALAAGAALGTQATALLVLNNLRDRHTDILAGKRTLAVRFGERFSRCQYALLLVASYGFVALAAAGSRQPGYLLTLLALPLIWRLIRNGFHQDGADLNGLLKQTAQTELLFGVLMSMGVSLW